MKIRNGFVSNSSSSSFIIYVPIIDVSSGMFVNVKFNNHLDVNIWIIEFLNSISDERLYFQRTKKDSDIEWAIQTKEYVDITDCEICKKLEDLFIKFKRTDKLKRILNYENKD